MNKKLVMLMMPLVIYATDNTLAGDIKSRLNTLNVTDLNSAFTAIAYVGKAATKDVVRNGADKTGRDFAAKWCDKTLIDNKASRAIVGGSITTQDIAAFFARALMSTVIDEAGKFRDDIEPVGIIAKRGSLDLFVHSLTQLLYNQLKLRRNQIVDYVGADLRGNIKTEIEETFGKNAVKAASHAVEGISYDLLYKVVLRFGESFNK